MKELFFTLLILAAPYVQAQSFILDENDATAPVGWPNGNSQKSVAFGGDYIHDNLAQDGSYVEWSLTGQVDSSKCYDVSAIWNANGAGTRATNVKYEIDHDGGTAQSFQNQNLSTNTFNVLSTSGGESVFKNPTSVRVYTGDSPSSERYIIADAIYVVERACSGTTIIPTVGGGGSLGSDAITSLMSFSAHANDCNGATEEFIEIGVTGLGFCIEKTERSTAQFDDARNTCVNLGMRLPEPGEFKLACKTGTALLNMTNNMEWASNFAMVISTDSYGAGTTAAAAGNGSCNIGSHREVGFNTGGYFTAPFRCVR